MGFADFAASSLGNDLPWFVWGFAALVVVGALGVLRVDLNASVLAVLLVLEIITVTLYDIGAFGHPAGGTVTTVGLSPGALFGPGVGAVFAFGIAAFVGFESGAIYPRYINAVPEAPSARRPGCRLSRTRSPRSNGCCWASGSRFWSRCHSASSWARS